MKRLLLAGLLVAPFALSRMGARAEQDDAYGSLVGMADSAASDQGPHAGAIPPENASTEENRAAGHPSGDELRTEFGSVLIKKTAKHASAPGAKSEAAKDDAPSVSVPAVSASRIWTSLFASLLPSMSRVPSYEVAVSTAAPRASPQPARPATAASVAGGARGLLELVATVTAP